MQAKNDRQRKILEIIASRPISTQLELQKALEKAGFSVNQGTLSRDIRELGLTKVNAGGQSNYVDITATTTTTKSLASVAGFVRSIDYSANIIVIKTDSGAAGPVAEALDALSHAGVMGTVAGDNTIFLLVAADKKSADMAATLRRLFA